MNKPNYIKNGVTLTTSTNWWKNSDVNKHPVSWDKCERNFWIGKLSAIERLDFRDRFDVRSKIVLTKLSRKLRLDCSHCTRAFWNQIRIKLKRYRFSGTLLTKIVCLLKLKCHKFWSSWLKFQTDDNQHRWSKNFWEQSANGFLLVYTYSGKAHFPPNIYKLKHAPTFVYNFHHNSKIVN